MTDYRSCWMDDDLDALRELARAFLDKEVVPNTEKYIAQHQVDRDLWNKAGELGLLCLSIPEEYGGGGGSFAHEAVLIEEQTKVGDTAWGQTLHNGIVAHSVGTCRMGTDPASVVTPRLEVRGVQGLRVADASVMPTIIRGHTHAPSIVIGAKAADLIADANRS